MNCPVCREELKKGETFVYEDVCGSSVTHKHTCETEGCICNEKNCYWSHYGDFFSGDMGYKLCNEIFPDSKYAAINSFAKKSEVEIYKKGLKKKTYLSPLLCLYQLQPYIEHVYFGNEAGEVLKRKYKLQFLKKDERGVFCLGYTSGISMLKYFIRSFKRDLNAWKEFPNNKFRQEQFLKQFDRGWDKRMSSKIFSWYINKFYSKTKEMVEGLTNN